MAMFPWRTGQFMRAPLPGQERLIHGMNVFPKKERDHFLSFLVGYTISRCLRSWILYHGELRSRNDLPFVANHAFLPRTEQLIVANSHFWMLCRETCTYYEKTKSATRLLCITGWRYCGGGRGNHLLYLGSFSRSYTLNMGCYTVHPAAHTC